MRLEQPIKAVEEMDVTWEGMDMEERAIQSLNAKFPILVTDSGMVTEVRCLHSSKVKLSMVVTLDGISIEMSPLLLKALAPIDVTELGMVMDVSPVQPSKAFGPIALTVLGIIVVLVPIINVASDFLIMALQLLRLSYIALPDTTFREVSRVQPSKALLEMDVTVLGMETEVSERFLKA